jgi:Kelch motif
LKERDLRKYFIMKLFILSVLHILLLIMLISTKGLAQNVGIGVPVPLQKLDVNGAIKIGTTATNQPGTIRFNAGKFEGGDGINWKSFEALPSKAIILARSIDTAGLRLVGFNVFKASDVQDIIDVTIPANLPGQWEFPNQTLTEPRDIYNYENVLYNNKLIFYNGDGILYQYDITSDLWSQLPGTSPLSVRAYPSMTLAGNEIYIFGGTRNNPFTVYSDGAKYNLTTNTWSPVANMPVGSFVHASCAIGNDIYIIGGASTTISSGIQLEKKIYRYNTVANSWSADLTTGNTPFATQGNALVRNNKILLVKGAVIEYDPALNSYTNLAEILNTQFFTNSALVGNDIYLYGAIRDTLFSDPPPAQANPIMLHYKVNLLNGQSTSLNNICNQSLNGGFFTYRYVSSVNKFYVKEGQGYGFGLFNPAGSFPCNVVGSYRSFLYYLQKQ